MVCRQSFTDAKQYWNASTGLSSQSSPRTPARCRPLLLDFKVRNDVAEHLSSGNEYAGTAHVVMICFAPLCTRARSHNRHDHTPQESIIQHLRQLDEPALDCCMLPSSRSPPHAPRLSVGWLNHTIRSRIFTQHPLAEAHTQHSRLALRTLPI